MWIQVMSYTPFIMLYSALQNFLYSLQSNSPHLYTVFIISCTIHSYTAEYFALHSNFDNPKLDVLCHKCIHSCKSLIILTCNFNRPPNLHFIKLVIYHTLIHSFHFLLLSFDHECLIVVFQLHNTILVQWFAILSRKKKVYKKFTIQCQNFLIFLSLLILPFVLEHNCFKEHVA